MWFSSDRRNRKTIRLRISSTSGNTCSRWMTVEEISHRTWKTQDVYRHIQSMDSACIHWVLEGGQNERTCTLLRSQCDSVARQKWLMKNTLYHWSGESVWGIEVLEGVNLIWNCNHCMLPGIDRIDALLHHERISYICSYYLLSHFYAVCKGCIFWSIEDLIAIIISFKSLAFIVRCIKYGFFVVCFYVDQLPE